MVCGKCANPSGSLKCSRCKIMTYCNRECQVAHWPEHKIRCKKFEMSPEKLRLQFFVGDKEILFLEDIPALLCQPNAPRELTSRWVSNLVDTHTEKVLEQHPGRCVYCSKQAMALKTTPMVTLNSKPPTILVLARHLCANNRSSPCAVKLEEELQRGFNSPDFPKGGELYRH
ncbi:Zinc finger MYND domain-containing protein 10 [Mycena sanguinolenta]|uniref:Zinc finger MYND domain-containing protein 10 n=1 Tax=Mycena sanguinolenta TaxID=230812 RepID=A0A8H7D527_9AGAR|nr:Zinc finger MYND domain-containing protein 10 [Mycena sanguinolenta]